jgi:hypothetical protein
VEENIPLDVVSGLVFLNPNELLSQLIFLEKTPDFILVEPHANALAADISVQEEMRNQDESCAHSDAMV